MLLSLYITALPQSQTFALTPVIFSFLHLPPSFCAVSLCHPLCPFNGFQMCLLLASLSLFLPFPVNPDPLTLLLPVQHNVQTVSSPVCHHHFDVHITIHSHFLWTTNGLSCRYVFVKQEQNKRKKKNPFDSAFRVLGIMITGHKPNQKMTTSTSSYRQFFLYCDFLTFNLERTQNNITLFLSGCIVLWMEKPLYQSFKNHKMNRNTNNESHFLHS